MCVCDGANCTCVCMCAFVFVRERDGGTPVDLLHQLSLGLPVLREHVDGVAEGIGRGLVPGQEEDEGLWQREREERTRGEWGVTE